MGALDLCVGLSVPEQRGAERSGKYVISTSFRAQLRGPHIVEVFLKRIRVGLQLRLDAILGSGNRSFNLGFDIRCCHYDQTASSVIQQLTQILQIRSSHSTRDMTGHRPDARADRATTSQACS
jgi:hypothetical protein